MNQKIERAGWILGPDCQCPDYKPQSAHPWRVILLGPPGVGKGTQADLLSGNLKACHLSTGDVFRAMKTLPAEQRTAAITAALEIMRRGGLVPDHIVLRLIRERLGCLRCGGGFLLDGFPRTSGQAQALAELLDGEGIALSAVINYVMPLGRIVERLSGRLTCSHCGAPFHLTENTPRARGICDFCSGPLVQREDDRPEIVEARMKNYQATAQPLLDYYAAQGLLLTIMADGRPQEVCFETINALNRLVIHHHSAGGFASASSIKTECAA